MCTAVPCVTVFDIAAAAVCVHGGSATASPVEGSHQWLSSRSLDKFEAVQEKDVIELVERSRSIVRTVLANCE